MPDRHRSFAESSAMQLVRSVWPTYAGTIDDQLHYCGYRPDTVADRTVMPPAIAEYAITAFTHPGGIVLDPDCGAGTTIVEALRAGRHAVGLTSHPRWWRLARANVTATKARGAPPDGMILVLNRRPTTIAAATTAGLTGRVDLLLTAARPAQTMRRLRTLLADSRPLLRPGGHAVVTVPPARHPRNHTLLDLPGEVLAAGVAAGLAPVARCVALTATPRETHVEALNSCPVGVPAHHTALIFRADPDAQDPALALPLPPIRFLSPLTTPARACAA
jgi:hypothetical protein